MKVRSLLPAFSFVGFVALALSQAACSSLSRPEEITIRAEPAAAPKAPAPAPQPLAMPGAANPAGAPAAAPGG